MPSKFPIFSICPYLCLVDCKWATYSPWTACTKTCGTGSKTRNRTCLRPCEFGNDCIGLSSQSSECNIMACPGTYAYFKMALEHRKFIRNSATHNDSLIIINFIY